MTTSRVLRSPRHVLKTAAFLALGSSLGGCAGDQAPQAWNALSTCLAGDAAQGELPARLKQLRQAQLGSAPAADGKEAWPATCNKYANDLYAALDTSGKQDLFRRKLRERLNCEDEKASCKVANDERLIPTTTELWEAAKSAELTASAAPGVPKPALAPDPLVNQQSWKSFAAKPQSLEGPWLASDGHAVLLLKDTEGRGKPTGCEIAAGFGKLTCVPPAADLPDLPLQSVRLVQDQAGLYAAGLTDAGLTAYDLKTGKSLGVRGGTSGLAVDGLALEGEGGEGGFVAVRLKQGKPGKDQKLGAESPLTKPAQLAGHAYWVEGGDGGNRLVIKGLAGDRLHDEAAFPGSFKGPLHTCSAEGVIGIAAWDKRSGQPSAKATAGSDKTQLTVTQFDGKAWSKPAEATIPFERVVESELVCTKSGVSMTYATGAPGALEIGRVDCTPEGCKTAAVKLPGVESRWWWLLSPVGDNVVMLWRSTLGETRLRSAPLAGLATAPDKVVFDSSEFGGPAVNDVTPIIGSDAALLVFRSERPVALRVGKDGSVSVLSP
jgi:hypothetical protein